MTTCTIQKFYNVKPLELAELMRLIGSDLNTGVAAMHRAWNEADGSFSSSGELPGHYIYRHISLLKAEPAKDAPGCFFVEVKISCFFEPAPNEHADPLADYMYWSITPDNKPAHVPRSLILAMYDCLGIFPAA